MTIVSPYDEPIKIWHNVSLEDLHVVICWNGNNHYSGFTYVETVLTKTGKDENMSISSMGKSGEENDEKMSVSSAGSPHRLSKDSQQTVEYEDPATLKEMSPDRNSSAGLSELADEVCDSAAKMLGRKREKAAAGSKGISKKF